VAMHVDEAPMFVDGLRDGVLTPRPSWRAWHRAPEVACWLVEWSRASCR
jgi:hypothetical protein